MTSYPRWRIVNIEATSLLNRTSTSTYKQPQSTSIIEIITLKWIHFYAVYRTCELFYSSCLSSSSIVSCIQFQHCIIVHPVPAAYRVSRNSIALLCIQFQQRIEIQFPNHINFSSTWITFTVHGLTSWCDYRAEAWITYLFGLLSWAELPGRIINDLPEWISCMDDRTHTWVNVNELL